MSQHIPKEKKQTILDDIDAGKSVIDAAADYSVSTKTIYGLVECAPRARRSDES